MHSQNIGIKVGRHFVSWAARTYPYLNISISYAIALIIHCYSLSSIASFTFVLKTRLLFTVQAKCQREFEDIMYIIQDKFIPETPCEVQDERLFPQVEKPNKDDKVENISMAQQNLCSSKVQASHFVNRPNTRTKPSH